MESARVTAQTPCYSHGEGANSERIALKTGTFLKGWGFPGGSAVKNLPAVQEMQVRFLVRKIPWRRKWQPTPVFLPEKNPTDRSLVGHSPWGCKESNTTEATEHACIKRLKIFFFFLGWTFKNTSRVAEWASGTYKAWSQEGPAGFRERKEWIKSTN